MALALVSGGCRVWPGVEDDVCAAEFAREPVEDETSRVVEVWLGEEAEVPALHLALAWPDRAPEEEGWPVALALQGTWSQAMADDGRVRVDEGVVEVRLDLPGGGQSGGLDDQRGEGSRAAVAAALRWLAGEDLDLGGCTAARRVPGLRTDLLYLLGLSNGGNLAVATLADPALSHPPVAGLVTWETPVSPQLVNVEFGLDPDLYTPGSCAWDPVDGLGCALPEVPLAVVPAARPPDTVCFDVDEDGGCLAGTDVLVAGTANPATGDRTLSPPLTAALEAAGLAPAGIDDGLEAARFWEWRNASRLAAPLVAAEPELPVLLVGTEEDHVQVAADHPQIFGWGEALQTSGAAWTRLNPGRRWLPEAAGENPPNTPLSLAAPTGRLLTEDEEAPLGGVLAAAVRELTERRRSGDWESP